MLPDSKVHQVPDSLATHHVFGKAPCRTSVAHQVPLRRKVKAARAQVVSCRVVTKENKRLPMGARAARQDVIRQGSMTLAFLSAVTIGWASYLMSLAGMEGMPDVADFLESPRDQSLRIQLYPCQVYAFPLDLLFEESVPEVCYQKYNDKPPILYMIKF